MKYCVGIDGGQTSTIAVVGDDRGRILGRGVAGPSDEVGEPPHSTRLHDAASAALSAALRVAGLSSDTRVCSVVLGISGYGDRCVGKEPELRTDHMLLLHDAPIAHAGAFGGGAGAIVIAGTGSVTYAVDARGASRTFGGWGFLFGDEGSAFWIARQALSTLMKRHDAGEVDAAAEAALIFFNVSSLRDVARGFAIGSIDRARLAAYATVALRSACFSAICERGARELATLARLGVADLEGEDRRVACVGGLFKDGGYAEMVSCEIAAMAPDVRVVRPRYEPAVGALLLAYRECGLRPAELVEA